MRTIRIGRGYWSRKEEFSLKPTTSVPAGCLSIRWRSSIPLPPKAGSRDFNSMVGRATGTHFTLFLSRPETARENQRRFCPFSTRRFHSLQRREVVRNFLMRFARPCRGHVRLRWLSATFHTTRSRVVELRVVPQTKSRGMSWRHSWLEWTSNCLGNCCFSRARMVGTL